MNNECISITLRKKNELAPPLGVIGRICYEQYVPADFFIKLSNRLQWMELHPFNSLPSIKFPSRGTCARNFAPLFFNTDNNVRIKLLREKRISFFYPIPR